MKVLVAVALFAFVALQSCQSADVNETNSNSEALAVILSDQNIGLGNFTDLSFELSHGAPAPEEEKKEEPAAVPSPSPAPSEATSEAAAPVEVKSEAPSSDAPAAAPAAPPAAPVAAETPAPAEEKKA